MDRTRTVASLVLSHPELATVFQEHRIDFCCRGDLTVSEACRERNVDEGGLWAVIERAMERREGAAPGEDFERMPTPQLIAHIITKHHGYLREVLPFLGTLAAKVARVHGERNPKLVALHAAYRDLRAALEPHLDEEESVIFPALMAKDRDARTLRAELEAMAADHRAIGAELARIRSAADDFAVPAWACTTYRTLFAELEALEADLLRHVHLENHVLMPRFAG